MGVGVEAHLRPRLREQLGELARRVRVGDARPVSVASARRGVADRDLRERRALLEAGVRGAVELGVVRRRDRAALRVELRRQEEVEVRLVPDRVEADERVAAVATRVAVRESAREVLNVGEATREPVLGRACPRRRAPDRQHHLDVAIRRLAHELVEVLPAVRRVERVRGVRGPPRRRVEPVDGRLHDRRVRVHGAVAHEEALGEPAEVRVVLEAHPHARRRACGCRRDERGENEQ